LRWEEWKPLYRTIVEEFDYSIEKDARAARILNALLANKRICDDNCLSKRIFKEVTICGGAANLQEHLDEFGIVGTSIAADNATSVLLANGQLPDLIVTDLDGNVREQIMANSEGAVIVVHAHGDNIPALQEYVPYFNGLISGTTQGREVGVLRNYGGFTDGDRAVSIARHFGATMIRLLGFDFESPVSKPGREIEVKRRKLAWARRLIFDNNPEQVVLWTPPND
jgi:2-amino-4-hydroxy-6-hydroxymethyldihydropteridine diphosphokinase